MRRGPSLFCFRVPLCVRPAGARLGARADGEPLEATEFAGGNQADYTKFLGKDDKK